MGDIYHAGEVYAGSVPIDDTQASEDTVYSSAKVETMMEEIQNRLDACTFDTAVDISGYTSSNKYTVPADGYIYFSTGNTKGNYVTVNLNGLPLFEQTQADGFPSVGMVYVRKGMKAYIGNYSGTIGNAKFYELI